MTSFLNHPVSSLKYFWGDKESLHEKVMLRTGRILLKDRFDPIQAREYLAEIREGDFVKMNESGLTLMTGNKPGHLFGKMIYASTPSRS